MKLVNQLGSDLLRVVDVCRSKQKYAGLDECSSLCMAMEGIHAVNGLECKIVCNSSKVCTGK